MHFKTKKCISSDVASDESSLNIRSQVLIWSVSLSLSLIKDLSSEFLIAKTKIQLHSFYVASLITSMFCHIIFSFPLIFPSHSWRMALMHQCTSSSTSLPMEPTATTKVFAVAAQCK